MGGRRVYEVWVSRWGNKPHRVGIWSNREKAEVVRATQDKLLNEFSGKFAGSRWIAWIEAKKLGKTNDKLNAALRAALSERGAVTPDLTDDWGASPERSLSQSATRPGAHDWRGRSRY